MTGLKAEFEGMLRARRLVLMSPPGAPEAKNLHLADVTVRKHRKTQGSAHSCAQNPVFYEADLPEP